MIKFMQRNLKIFYILLFMIILSFIFLYVGPIDDQEQTTPIIEVGSRKIYPQEFWKNYDNIEDNYRRLYKDEFNEEKAKELNLTGQTIMSLVTEELLFEASKAIGIVTSKKELNDAIVNDPVFIRDGVFSKQVYINILKRNGIPLKAFEAQRANQLSTAKMRNLIELSTTETVKLDDSLKELQDDEEILKSLKESLLRQKYNKLLAAYIDGFSKQVPVVIRRDMISN